MSATPRRALVAAAAGNFIEWYEFAVYGFLASLMARHFFQLAGVTPLTAMLLTWASFAIAFFFRPLGALLFGRLGDRYGRRPTLIAVLVLMTLTTSAIGLLPTWSTLGVAAPLLLTLLRILQGVFAGGEFGGAVALMTEYAPPGRRGYYGAWQSFTVALGLLGGIAVVALLAWTLGEAALYAGAWRIPFLLALPLGAVALWLRLHLPETPTFSAQQQADPPPRRPSVSDTLRTLALGMGRLMIWSAAGYTFLVIMPGYLQTSLHAGLRTALLLALLSNLGFALTILPAGWLSDRLGRRRVMVTAAVILLLLTLPLLKVLQADVPLLWKGLAVMLAGAVVGMLAGPGPAMLAEMFPTRVRFTGLGLTYSLSNALFSGCAGLIITALVRQTGYLDMPAWYVMVTALISIAALMTLRPDDHRRPLRER
ncbi:MFS transporter [Pantoea sp. 1.19]|uniref:MFS transporter n=1 Tax=Pantoea sp. 1.19 TaxID=1925589 RepID=UPI0009489E08|nr:MFS transporter [Pantoea sp. 1.19]